VTGGQAAGERAAVVMFAALRRPRHADRVNVTPPSCYARVITRYQLRFVPTETEHAVFSSSASYAPLSVLCPLAETEVAPYAGGWRQSEYA